MSPQVASSASSQGTVGPLPRYLEGRLCVPKALAERLETQACGVVSEK